MRSFFDITADLDTPVSAYLKLKSLEPRFLLESVEGGERIARFSFIGLGVGLEVRLDGDGITVDGERRPLPSGRNELLAEIRAAVERAPRPRPAPPGVPFTGGLVGALGFGLHRWFEEVVERGPAPEPPRGRFFAPRSVLVFDHMTRRAGLLHDGSEEERAALRQQVVTALRGALPEPAPAGTHEPPVGSLSPDAFTEAVLRAKRHIEAGDIYQIVLSIGFSGRTDLHPFEVYRALRLLNPSPYLYYLDFGDLQIVGSSPEALVTLSGREASLRPIAGTRPRAPSEAEDEERIRDLLADPKENAEHVMLVDLARNDLGRVAVPGSVQVTPYRTIERYSHVIHMVSGVRGVLAPGRDGLDLFAAAFPAGTVVGAPKIRAGEIIRQLEPTPRGFYAGSVGYFGAGGTLDQAIAIRTLVFENGRYTYQAGAGIVADSDPVREYQEVLAKSEALRSALAWAQEGL
ncbi:MAG: anthranilate synthase component I family protein [Gemmatimonadota bacterium]